MKELRFEGLLNPENYHEIEGYDSRIAIMKFLDARETMGFAGMSLSYSKNNKPSSDQEVNFVRAIHLRHAVIDLNNSFDLMLQIPWLFYRAWSLFNSSGSLGYGKLKNYYDVVRNANGWVSIAENECDYKKLLRFLDDKVNPLKSKFETFYNVFIKNPHKPYTVRTLSNTMKHKHVLSFSELYEPYNFSIKTANGIIDGNDIKKKNLRFEMCQEFYNKDAPDNTIGTVETIYENDIEIDIKYKGGENFFFKDCTHVRDRYTLDEVSNECELYFDALVDLFEDVYADIYPQIFVSLNFQPPTNKSSKQIDLNKYFIPLE